MSEGYVSSVSLPDYRLWEGIGDRRVPLSFNLEITARCNFDCRHCYIRLPAGNLEAQRAELTLAEIEDIADQAVSLGTLWCLVTGGEPLLRPDFPDVYLALKKKGLLVTVFTNASAVTGEHVRLFRSYPPRDIEVTVYGATPATYERVTRRPGSYADFRRGLDLLLQGGVKVRLKAMAIRSNVHELPEIARFCRERTKDYFRFDPLLNLRYDGDEVRNRDIREERLPAEEIAAVEQADEERASSLARSCGTLISPRSGRQGDDHIFGCGAGTHGFAVSYDGRFRLCSSLCAPNSQYDLRSGTLADAWNRFVHQVRAARSASTEFLEKCGQCSLVNLCLWCPANAYLETGRIDGWSQYFCDVAHSRGRAIETRAIGTHTER
ncbi:MAG: radical SAM protein [Actinobacteria bacterium]|nr:radical SAM protein [Actinomycetota bacterium]